VEDGRKVEALGFVNVNFWVKEESRVERKEEERKIL